MEKLKIYHVTEEYIRYLRNFDNKVTIIKDYGKARPYVGEVFQINQFKYFAPFSSPEKDNDGNLTEDYKKYYKKNNNPTYEKIEDLKYGTIQINNMIPVSEQELIYFEIEQIEDENYKVILSDQFIYCDNNKERIINKAKKLYKYVVISKNPHFANLSCNFKLLEQRCKEYESIKQTLTEPLEHIAITNKITD